MCEPLSESSQPKEKDLRNDRVEENGEGFPAADLQAIPLVV